MCLVSILSKAVARLSDLLEKVLERSLHGVLRQWPRGVEDLN
jgi:hypothetical protein